MTRKRKHILLTAILLILFTGTLSAQDSSSPTFGFDLGIGAETFDGVTWQTLTFSPDLALGKFGVGVDVTLHYSFTGGEEGNEFLISGRDWVPADAGLTFLELYLPKIRYIRYGTKGEPLFVKLGSIDDATLGNGFIIGNYANTLFLPQRRIFGLSFDLDGSLFKFPILGIETFVGDLTAFDILGARLFVRPLSFTEIPLLKHLEVGATAVFDFDPYKYIDDKPEGYEDFNAMAFGFDLVQPILGNPLISLAAFGDLAFTQKKEGFATGGMLGVGGQIISFITYGAQLRIMGDNFIPVYFDASYDLYRAAKYQIAQSDTVIEGFVGYLASMGFSLMDSKIAFNASIDGPFKSLPETATENFLDYPHLRGVFVIAEGIVPGFSFDAVYDKKFIDSFASLIDPDGAIIEANINYRTGPAIITFTYSIRYNPNATGEENPWETTAGLKSSISLF